VPSPELHASSKVLSALSQSTMCTDGLCLSDDASSSIIHHPSSIIITSIIHHPSSIIITSIIHHIHHPSPSHPSSIIHHPSSIIGWNAA
jgi:hypothetical protein